ncbi:hypothetical protein [Bradyrhizobium sp. USDA 10063]
MSRLDERTVAKMDLVLEQVCKGLSAYGGNHKSRKFVALKMIEAARQGNTTLGELEITARQALQELIERKSA